MGADHGYEDPAADDPGDPAAAAATSAPRRTRPMGPVRRGRPGIVALGVAPLVGAAVRTTAPGGLPRRPTLRTKLAEYVDSGDLTVNLTLRELRGRYKRSFLGWAWSLLNPLATVVDLLARLRLSS